MPSTVGTSNTTYGVWPPSERQIFYANGRFWVFYQYDGNDEIVYCTSIDGSTWSDPLIVRTGIILGDFDVRFDGTYLHYACEANEVCYYRRGIPNTDGTITWNDEQIVATNVAAKFGICTDSAGYPWITYVTTSPYKAMVVKSSKNDGTWETAPGFPYLLSMNLQYPSVVPLTDGKVYVIFCTHGTRFYGRLWNGSSWGSQEAVSSSNSVYALYYSVVAKGDDVHLVFQKDIDYHILYIKRSYGTGWGSEIIVQPSLASYLAPVLSIDNSGTLYCFWMGSPTADHVFYKRCVAGVWDTDPVDWIDETADHLGHAALSCDYRAYNGYVALVYLTGVEAPFNVRHAFIETLLPEPGPSGFALEFNGIDTYVEVADSPSLDIANAITIEAWIYLDDVTPTPDWRTIIAKIATQNAEAYGFLTNSDQSTISFYKQNVSSITDDIQKNKWNHVVATFTIAPGDNICLYVDGSLRGCGEVGHTPIPTSDLPLVIGGGTRAGNSFAPYFFKGLLDKIRIYNRILTPTEVQEHFNGIFNDETGLVGLWNFDEGSGTETADGSGNENNGILFNNPQWVEVGIPSPPSDLCTWLTGHGAPSNILVTDVFAVINSYLFETPPNGYTFIPTLQNTFGVIDYHFGFNGDAMTGCNFFP